ncbi:processed acidic surface protein [Bacillus sp. CECT 9360]|uniref:processed acidic surface protein n=1 Tax=Bacillus sp. CECT 9360 TaxID=2845821 RepID=UPI001E617D9C|nr:processed acidic surface protein [Bacillus sp. CECT 9360]CAH0344799.1 hypothetical protein BCI9360_01066 [Bacillus sp. CECT 9360]
MKKFLMIVISSVIVLMSSIPVFAAVSDQELNDYLAGTMTKSEFLIYLEDYDLNYQDYESIDALREEIGDPLTRANLDIYLEENGITEEELTTILIESGEIEEGQSILDAEYFHFTFELDFYLEEPLTDEDYETLKPEVYADLKETLDELSITQEEFYKFYDHVNNVRKGTDITSALEELNLLAEDLLSVGEFESIDDISEEEIAEMLAIYEEIQQIFQVEFSYALVQNGTETDLSLQALLQLDELSKDTVLKVNVYALNTGEKLLDLIITPEMFNDDLIEDVGDDLKDATQTAPVKTEKGGKLPKTAGDYMAGMLMGLLLIGGSVVFMKKAGSVK